MPCPTPFCREAALYLVVILPLLPKGYPQYSSSRGVPQPPAQPAVANFYRYNVILCTCSQIYQKSGRIFVTSVFVRWSDENGIFCLIFTFNHYILWFFLLTFCRPRGKISVLAKRLYGAKYFYSIIRFVINLRHRFDEEKPA